MPITRAGCISLLSGITSTRASTSRPSSARTGWTSPAFSGPYLVMASACGHLGRRAEAAGRGPGSAGARSRVCGARALERRDLALRERPDGSDPRRAAQGGALDSGRAAGSAPRAWPGALADHTFGRGSRRRGLLGRRAAVQVRRRRRVAHGPGRRADRGDRDRAVAVLLPEGDRARRDGRRPFRQ